MTEKDIFNTPEEEVKRLANEIAEIKNVLGDLSRTLSHIETRVKRAFPSAYPKTTPSNRKQKSSLGTETPTITPERAISIYDELVNQAKEDINQVKERLSSFNIVDLNLIRQELGVSLGKKKPSQKPLIDAILSRINESIKLTQHVNRKQLLTEAPISETPPSEDKQ